MHGVAFTFAPGVGCSIHTVQWLYPYDTCRRCIVSFGVSLAENILVLFMVYLLYRLALLKVTVELPAVACDMKMREDLE